MSLRPDYAENLEYIKRYGFAPKPPLTFTAQKELRIKEGFQCLSSGAQTITGVKTFADSPQCAALPSAGTSLVNKQFVVDHMTRGISWVEPVLGFANLSTMPVAGLANGARYINTVTAGDFLVDNIYQWSTSDGGWIAMDPPHEGLTCMNTADAGLFANQDVLYNGSAWVNIGSSVQFGSLQGAPTGNTGADLSSTGSPAFSALSLTSTSKQSVLGNEALLSKITIDPSHGADTSLSSHGDSLHVSSGNVYLGGVVTVMADTASSHGIVTNGVVDAGSVIAATSVTAPTIRSLSSLQGVTETLSGGVESTNTSSGTLVVSGGIGASGAVNCGSISSTGAANIAGVTTISNTSSGGTSTSGALVVSGGLGVAGRIVSGWFMTATNYVYNVGLVPQGATLTMNVNSHGRILMGTGATTGTTTLLLPSIQTYSGGLRYRVSCLATQESHVIKTATGETLATIAGTREISIESIASGTPDTWSIVSLPMNFVVTGVMSGAHSGNVSLAYVRSGKSLTVRVSGFSFTALSTAPITITPPNYQGLDPSGTTVVVLSNAMAQIGSSGVITLYANINGANFTSGTAYTVLSSAGTYIAATI